MAPAQREQILPAPDVSGVSDSRMPRFEFQHLRVGRVDDRVGIERHPVFGDSRRFHHSIVNRSPAVAELGRGWSQTTESMRHLLQRSWTLQAYGPVEGGGAVTIGRALLTGAAIVGAFAA